MQSFLLSRSMREMRRGCGRNEQQAGGWVRHALQSPVPNSGVVGGRKTCLLLGSCKQATAVRLA